MLEQRNLLLPPSAIRPATSLARLAQRKVTFLIRLSLALVFFWFGMLKLTGVSPAVELLRNSVPFLATSPYVELLGVAEIIIGIGLLVDRFSEHAATLMILHLLCTLALVLIAPSLIFAPAFPVLTMTGEFVAKNLVLITAGLAVISAPKRGSARDTGRGAEEKPRTMSTVSVPENSRAPVSPVVLKLSTSAS